MKGIWVVPALASILILSSGLFDNSAYGQIAPGEDPFLEFPAFDPNDIFLPVAPDSSPDFPFVTPLPFDGDGLYFGDLSAGTGGVLRVNIDPDTGRMFLGADSGGAMLGRWDGFNFGGVGGTANFSPYDAVRVFLDSMPTTTVEFSFTFDDGTNTTSCTGVVANGFPSAFFDMPITAGNCSAGFESVDRTQVQNVSFEVFLPLADSGVTITGVTLVIAAGGGGGSGTGTVDIDNTCGATVGAPPADTANFGTMEAGVDTGTDTIVVTNTGTQPASTLSVAALTDWLATLVTNSAANIGDTIYGAGITQFGPTAAVGTALTFAPQTITAAFVPGAFEVFFETTPGTPTPADFRGNMQVDLEFSVTCP